jgi:hypothetical protein
VRVLFALLGVVAGCLASGCGILSGHSVPDDASGELEAQVTRQLPSEIKHLTGTAGYVRDVGCVRGDESSYECIATVSGPNSYGEYTTERISIEGTCDERQCLWKASP